MTRRLVGLGLLAAAILVHVGLTLPARRARDGAREAFAQKREERERLRAQLVRLERRVRPARPDAPAAAARGLRRALLGATRDLALGDVQIAAQPGRREGAAARGRLAGTGRQVDVLRVAGRLAEPDSGVVLERVEMALRPEGVRLEVEATSVRGSPPDAGPPHGGEP